MILPLNYLHESVQVRGHNKLFWWKIRKIIKYSLLSRGLQELIGQLIFWYFFFCKKCWIYVKYVRINYYIGLSCIFLFPLRKSMYPIQNWEILAASAQMGLKFDWICNFLVINLSRKLTDISFTCIELLELTFVLISSTCTVLICL